jgi:hypothetical protein
LQQIGAAVMSSVPQPSGMPSITVRPSAEEKRLFAALAARHGISESKLALIAVRSLIRDNFPNGLACDDPAPVNDPGTDRITIRLRPGDLRAIAQRAAARKMRPSKYLATLVRGHVLSNPPLATVELEALKQSIVVLAKYGTVWARVIRIFTQQAGEPAELLRLLTQTRAAFESLEGRMHDLVYESLRSWESAYG